MDYIRYWVVLRGRSFTNPHKQYNPCFFFPHRSRKEEEKKRGKRKVMVQLILSFLKYSICTLQVP